MSKKILTWEDNFNKLKNIYLKTGSCKVSKNTCDSSLYSWVCRQKRDKMDGILKADKEELLLSIEFEFNESWEQLFDEFKKYFTINNNTYINKDMNNNKKLKKWFNNQTKLIESNRLPKNKIEMYSNLGIKFNSKKSLYDIWYDSYLELKNFYLENGHCNVPTDKKFKSLYRFVQTQRSNFKNNKLSKEKIALLSEINFCFDKWFEKYLIAKDYYLENQNLMIDGYDDENSSLRTWIYNTRDSYKKGKLSDFQIEKLNEINFPFDITASDKTWLNKYYKATLFFNEHNHCSFTPTNVSYEIFEWALEQSELFFKNELSSYVVNRLNKIKFDFNIFKYSKLSKDWILKYNKLSRFSKYKGHCYVSPLISSGSLYNWVIEQNKLYHEDKLSDVEIDLLLDINFDLENNLSSEESKTWLKNYLRLSNFKNEYGHCIVDDSQSFKSLYKWSMTQKELHSRNLLRNDFYIYLKEIEFDFNSPWMNMFNRFKIYYNLHHSIDIPQHKHFQYREIDVWLREQISLFKKNKLPNHLIEAFNDIGVDFKNIIN